MNRICIVRLSALGDIINSAIVLQMIRRHHPEACIEWITEEQFAPILLPHPDLAAVHTVPLKRLKREKSFTLLRETIRKLRVLQPFDIIIDLQGLLKSAVVARLAGPKVHGFDADSARESAAALFYRTRSRISYDTNIIRRNCQLAGEALGFAIDDSQIRDKAPTLTMGLRPDFVPERYIAIIVGASWPSKCYPPERWSQVCRTLSLPCILVWGSESEHADAQKIAALASNASLTPKLDLPTLRSVIGYAALTLGGDTGPTHLAWALNRPSVTLYGPTTPRMMFETPQNLALESDSPVDVLAIDKTDMSLRQIPSEHVIAKAMELL